MSGTFKTRLNINKFQGPRMRNLQEKDRSICFCVCLYKNIVTK
ncbi:MAG: hypothetical protein Phog2KO_50260 [Phototrophicaceae bacterium]